jgi:uncharacterized membrane protein
MSVDFINWPYYLYIHRGWISRLVETINYIGDGYYEHKVSLDINTRELESYLIKNGFDCTETPYLLIPLNDLDVTLLPEFDARDEEGRPLSLLSLEERISHEIAIVDGYVRDNFHTPLTKGIKRHLEYKFINTVYESLSDGDIVYSFDINWEEVSKDIHSQLSEADKDRAQQQWETLIVDYGFQWLIQRFIFYWIPIVVVKHQFNNEKSPTPQIPRIIKYRYIEPHAELTTYQACQHNSEQSFGENLAEFLLKKVGWHQFFGMVHGRELSNVASSEREYFKLLAPEGVELTNFQYTRKNRPNRKIKFYDTVCASQDEQVADDDYSVEVKAIITPERAVIRTRRWWFENDRTNASDDWKPPRIPKCSADDHIYSVSLRFLPACRGMWTRYLVFSLLVLIFLIVGRISLDDFKLFTHILDPGASSTVLIQVSAVLLPLFSSVITARGAVGYLRRYLLRWPTIMIYTLGALVALSGIVWIAYTSYSEYVTSPFNSLTEIFHTFWIVTLVIWLVFVVFVLVVWVCSTNTRRRWNKHPEAMRRFDVIPTRTIIDV